ncbi:hypothetical protein CRV15_04365 [Streptomyces clavuligerus]|uniref:Uncharacterized protein n=1 Tax=Streptomyces clavuligerus TaxID=1901 RepID=B5GUV0_STRCL|nr:hypothetical protein D1794_04945 [Streptomyces clavuligerus]EDY50096.1 hypothetical protein SSCG_03085 [Streptomyces clavuligerus]EFG09905.1 Hypothetical protein SCLAV_4832 [Streptomyces clavuligerus]QCS04913.1 hypothetical protein CRV15_04365 [Streptomyces clavuligerus]QPJ95716.1 hypothetical protein GE265_23535 [Streptomyces clavuligerus]
MNKSPVHIARRRRAPPPRSVAVLSRRGKSESRFLLTAGSSADGRTSPTDSSAQPPSPLGPEPGNGPWGADRYSPLSLKGARSKARSSGSLSRVETSWISEHCPHPFEHAGVNGTPPSSLDTASEPLTSPATALPTGACAPL